MEATAKQRNIRVPARKIRRVIDAIRGKSVKEASAILKFMPYFAAKIVEKNLKCAVANASEKWGSRPEELIICEAYADEGSTYKRARPRAQGRIYRIHKKTSHLALKVRVSEELKEKLKEKKKATKSKTTKKTPKAQTQAVKEETKNEVSTEVLSTEVVEVKKQEVVEKTVEENSKPKKQAKNVESEEKATTEAEEKSENAENKEQEE
jgi:large subunit ribosomal protein L22